MTLKLAHLVVVTPRRCGLYETSRELVSALRKHGVDSRIYDPKESNEHHPGGTEDRGAVFCDRGWADQADVIVNHSGLGAHFEKADKPIVMVIHGRPRSSFLIERRDHTPIYSYHYHKNSDKRFKAAVTFWPEHVGYHRVMLPDIPIRYVQPPVDLEAWTPNGPKGYGFHGKAGRLNFVCVDPWRDDIDPYGPVNAFALWARRYPGSKLHIYGAGKLDSAWSALLKRVKDDGNLGEVKHWVTGLDNVFRAADCLLSPQTIYTRSIREAMACGCPVQRVNGTLHIDPTQLPSRTATRQLAETLFAPAHTAKQFEEVIHGCI